MMVNRMAKIKGSMLAEFVKTIRSDKSGAYDSFLTSQDKEIISQQVLASIWYPFDTYKRCFDAVVKVLAKDDMEKVRQWGHVYGERIIRQVYKNLMGEKDPLEALSKYKTIHRVFFDFGEFEIKHTCQNSALIELRDFDVGDFEPLYHMIRGWMEKSLELSGAKDVQSEFVQKSWKGDPFTSIKLWWS
jgi:hypothetical protein